MPVLVDSDVKSVLDHFDGGSSVGQLAFNNPSKLTFSELLNTINDLYERGFLREQPDPDRFTPRPVRVSRRAMNIWVHINNFCNLDCSYCFVEHSKIYMKEETIANTVRLIGRTVRQNHVEDVLVKFAGGEPTLTLPQMELFHQSLNKELDGTGALVHYTVLTNGTNVNERFLRFIEQSQATVSISVDGYGEYHDIYRVFRRPANQLNVLNQPASHPKGSWSIISRNIETLRKKGHVPYINAMVGPKTSKGLPELAEWIFGNGMIGTIHVVRNLEDSWTQGEERRAAYSAYCAQLAEDFERMFQRLEQPQFRLNLPRWMEIAELSFENPLPDICCGIGSDHIVIKHDGTLASCPMTVHERTVVPVDDLFDAAKQTFDASPDRRGADVCLSCQWFKVCASACPVANERIQGHAFTQSPLCKFWKYVIPRYVVFYGTKLLQAKETGWGPIWSGYATK